MTQMHLPALNTTGVATPIAVAFGRRLRSLREQHCRHVVTLAQDVAVSTATLELIEAGLQEPDLVLLDRLSRCFHMSLSELLTGL